MDSGLNKERLRFFQTYAPQLMDAKARDSFFFEFGNSRAKVVFWNQLLGHYFESILHGAFCEPSVIAEFFGFNQSQSQTMLETLIELENQSDFAMISGADFARMNELLAISKPGRLTRLISLFKSKEPVGDPLFVNLKRLALEYERVLDSLELIRDQSDVFTELQFFAQLSECCQLNELDTQILSGLLCHNKLVAKSRQIHNSLFYFPSAEGPSAKAKAQILRFSLLQTIRRIDRTVEAESPAAELGRFREILADGAGLLARVESEAQLAPLEKALGFVLRDLLDFELKDEPMKLGLPFRLNQPAIEAGSGPENNAGESVPAPGFELPRSKNISNL